MMLFYILIWSVIYLIVLLARSILSSVGTIQPYQTSAINQTSDSEPFRLSWQDDPMCTGWAGNIHSTNDKG